MHAMNHFQYKASELYAEVMVKGDLFEVVRERETIEELVKGERLAGFL
jgi:diaminopimelate decarboxylase